MTLDAPEAFDVAAGGSKDARPQRPSLPPLFVLAAGLWATSVVAYLALGSQQTGVSFATGCVGALLVLACGVWLWRSRGSGASLLCLGLALGICCGGYGAYALHAQADEVSDAFQLWEFQLVEDASRGMYGSSAVAQGRSEAGDVVKVRLNFSEDVDLLCGSTIHTRVSLKDPSAQSVDYCWRQGVAACANVSTFDELALEGPMGVIREMRATAVEQFARYGGEQAGILQALACGYRNTIEETGVYENYKITGLAHIVAVSGAHLSLVTAMLGLLLRALRQPRAVVMVVSALFVAAYLVLAGVPISAVRAAAMVLLSFGARLSRRRSASLNALGLCVIAFIALDPPAAVSVSLFLSAASTAGIIVFVRLVTSWFGDLSRLARALVAEPLSLTLASSAATLPFSAALFSQLSLIAPVANVVASPLFSLGCVAGLISAVISCIAPSAADVTISLASVLVMPLEAAVGMLAGVPHACVAVSLPVAGMIVASAGICALLWIAWPQVTLKLLGALTAVVVALIGAFGFASPWLHGDEIIMLDVGQGDAFLVRSAGACVLIDTGNQDAKLRTGLGQAGVYALDGVVISHADDDHCASLSELDGLVEVAGVYVAADALECACDKCMELRSSAYEVLGVDGDASAQTSSKAGSPESRADNLVGLEVGDEIQVGNFTLHVVWPHDFTEDGGNADSLCLLATLDCDRDGVGDWSALFCGDAESEQLEAMVAEGAVSAVDVLKVGHHGARVALTDDLARTLSPQVALISAGANNRYGHPSSEALECLEQAGARIVRTDVSGTVRLSFDKDALRVG